MEIVRESEPTRLDEFTELAERYHRELLVYAKLLTRDHSAAWDTLQEALVAAWQSIDKFDGTRDFAAWVRGIIRNKWLESNRKNRRQLAFEESVLEAIEAELRNWQQLHEAGGPAVFEKLEICLEKLPEPLAVAIRGFYYEGNRGDEVAEQLGIQPATMRKRLERARGQLRECLSQN